MLTINAKHKKAISPIIAGIMLIAVALISGLLVSTFSSTLVTKQTEKSPMCTLTTYYSIESAKYNLASGIIKIKITNRGKDDIYNFSIEADNGTVTTITPFTPSSTYKLKQGRSIYLKGYKSNLGNLNTIRIIPNSCPQKIAQLKVNNIDLTGNLVLNLHLDENQGTIAYDSSGYGNTGTLYNNVTVCSDPPTAGCPKWVDGKYGKAIELDGAYDVVAISSSLINLLSADKITIEAWINAPNIDTTGHVFAGRYERYCAFGGSSTNNIRIKLRFTDGDWSTDTTTSPIIPNQWNHIVATWDGSEVKLYHNGANVKTVEKSGTLDKSGIYGFYIGGRTETTNLFDGTIDEVRIYTRALSADEIIELAS